MRLKLGELMIGENLITHDDLDSALEYQSQRGGVLGRVMLRLGFVKKGDLFLTLSRQMGIPSVDLRCEEIDPLAVASVPAEIARKYHFMPFRLAEKVLSIAIADPTDLAVLDEIRFATGYQLEPSFAPSDQIDDAIHLYYRDWLSLLRTLMELPDGILIQKLNASPRSDETDAFIVQPDEDFELEVGELESGNPDPMSSSGPSLNADTGNFEAVSQEKQPPIQFSIFHPRAVIEQNWNRLLTYVHLPQCLVDIRADSEVRMRSSKKEYRLVDTTATQIIARGAEIVAVPELEGCRFNPPRASILWLEDWHCLDFKFQASPAVPGFMLDAPMTGRVRFYVGPVQVAEVGIWVYVCPEVLAQDEEIPARLATGEIYNSVFVSYSHDDSVVADLLEKTYQVLGMQYLRDIRVLRSGQEWNRALLGKIEQADLFQLLWSTRAKDSEYVEREWRHALTLNRPSFIRPTYWEQPMPAPPPGLSSLHFSFLELSPSAQ